MKEAKLIISPECFKNLIDYRNFLVKHGHGLDTVAPTIYETKRTFGLYHAFQILSEWVLQGHSCEILARKEILETDAGFWDIICRTE